MCNILHKKATLTIGRLSFTTMEYSCDFLPVNMVFTQNTDKSFLNETFTGIKRKKVIYMYTCTPQYVVVYTKILTIY